MNNTTRVAQGFENHVILYAKGWYKDHPLCQSKNHINNLKRLLAKWAALDYKFIPAYDIWGFVISCLLLCRPAIPLKETLLEMLGYHWTAKTSYRRAPIQSALGRIGAELTVDQFDKNTPLIKA